MSRKKFNRKVRRKTKKALVDTLSEDYIDGIEEHYFLERKSEKEKQFEKVRE